ncbi:MAG: hypothetical protein OXF07_07520 [Rhodobacter sp.]|nr:hypothetical protein [Rhodobacter sp.]MCY4167340.1 hypothetical protein [Rhodobacter sp.]MCY4241607.1 hypothetical protein [Rhodobacter sp.]
MHVVARDHAARDVDAVPAARLKADVAHAEPKVTRQHRVAVRH